MMNMQMVWAMMLAVKPKCLRAVMNRLCVMMRRLPSQKAVLPIVGSGVDLQFISSEEPSGELALDGSLDTSTAPSSKDVVGSATSKEFLH